MTDLNQKEQASTWFAQLRDEIVAAFEAIETNHTTGPLSGRAAGRFEVSNTKRTTSTSHFNHRSKLFFFKFILHKSLYT